MYLATFPRCLDVCLLETLHVKRAHPRSQVVRPSTASAFDYLHYNLHCLRFQQTVATEERTSYRQ